MLLGRWSPVIRIFFKADFVAEFVVQRPLSRLVVFHLSILSQFEKLKRKSEGVPPGTVELLDKIYVEGTQERL